MNRHSIASAILVASLVFANAAHADVETWRLSATVYRYSSEFTAPSFAMLGQTLHVDYVIDTDTPLASGFYTGAVQSVSFNGQTSLAQGYVLAWDSLNAINISTGTGREDGVDFLSFNRFGPTPTSNLVGALHDFSAAAPTSSADLRLDFGTDSVWAQPTSFTVSPVPEPSTVLLMLAGCAGLVCVKRKSRVRSGVGPAKLL